MDKISPVLRFRIADAKTFRPEQNRSTDASTFSTNTSRKFHGIYIAASGHLVQPKDKFTKSWKFHGIYIVASGHLVKPKNKFAKSWDEILR